MNKKSPHYEGNQDKRFMQKRLMNSEITEEELKDYLNSLPDVSYNAEEITVSLEDKR
jgi:hypothetical protein